MIFRQLFEPLPAMAEFERIMARLMLAYPTSIDHAVPCKRRCRVCPDDLRERRQANCQYVTDSPQG